MKRVGICEACRDFSLTFYFRLQDWPRLCILLTRQHGKPYQ